MTKELIVSYTRKDFRVDTFRAGGKGGQHQNKTDSGVRITHLASGLASECREHASQLMNKKEAFRKLSNLVLAWHRRTAYVAPEKPTDTVRTYHEPENRVKDHTSGEKYTWDEAMKNFGQLIEDRHKFMTSEE